MTIPRWEQFMVPVLQTLKDGACQDRSQIREQVIAAKEITQEQLSERLESGQTRFTNRLGWAISYLTRAQALERPVRGNYRITGLGTRLLNENPTELTLHDLAPYLPAPGGDAAPGQDSTTEALAPADESALDPVERIEQGINQVDNLVAADLLARLRTKDPAFFETAVVKLLVAMGYGGVGGEAQVTPLTNDNGIDGIIDQDVLGLNRVYVQAKRYAEKNTVTRPEVQSFVGALSGRATSGMFITTGRFSPNALKYIQEVPVRVVAVDGQLLTRLMIRFRVGVQIRQTYDVIEIDEDFFD